eukprot:6824131-Prymnesium_polylepis.1
MARDCLDVSESFPSPSAHSRPQTALRSWSWLCGGRPPLSSPWCSSAVMATPRTDEPGSPPAAIAMRPSSATEPCHVHVYLTLTHSVTYLGDLLRYPVSRGIWPTRTHTHAYGAP